VQLLNLKLETLCGAQSNKVLIFDALKDSLANVETLAYFDRNAEETKLITDTSPVGLGAVLTQVQGGCERVVTYASRSLTDVER